MKRLRCRQGASLRRRRRVLQAGTHRVKLIFSRKGFDGGSGGGPSPIIEGCPVSLPIPSGWSSRLTYADLGLGALVREASKGRIPSRMNCHYDPMFEDGRCAFGQVGAAQSHLAGQQAGRPGDVFLFFGLFAEPGGKPHHRMFGYLEVEERIELGPNPGAERQPRGFSRLHPHVLGQWAANNCLYVGPGLAAKTADAQLRLTAPDLSASVWEVPPWVRQAGLTYHGRAERWLSVTRLRTVGRGQEFVCALDRLPAKKLNDAERWIRSIIDTITPSSWYDMG